MRLKIAFVTLLLFSTWPRHELAAQQRPTDECLVCDGKKSVALAGVEVMSINTLVWAFNRFVTKVDHGYVTLESWKRNLREGFEWDPNHFSTNQLQHPYHGAAYFTAARSRGFSYWESIPFLIFGSLTWEYFGEPHRPSINDFITTSLGGSALGEMTYRFSSFFRGGSTNSVSMYDQGPIATPRCRGYLFKRRLPRNRNPSPETVSFSECPHLP